MFKNIFSVPIYHGKLDNWKKYNRDLLPACQAVRKETEDMSELPWNCHVWSTYAYDTELNLTSVGFFIFSNMDRFRADLLNLY